MAPEPGIIPVPLPGPPYRMHYWRWGDPNASRTVLCVHGLTRNGRDFDFLAEALANDFQVICPDMPGRGASEWLKNPLLYNYQTYIVGLQCLLATLQLSQVRWIGTSMGGILGMMMANAMPGVIQSLTLNDVGCTVAREGLLRILSYAGVRMAFDCRAEAEAELRRICAPFGIRDEKHWRHFLDHSLYDRIDGKTAFAYDPAIINGLPQEELVQDIQLWGLWELVKQVPTLLIRGECSDILRRDTAQAMQDTHPNLTYYEIAGAGHAPALMAEDQIRTIKNWLG